MKAAPAKIDVRIETPFYGFSLEEYARDGVEKVLVRGPEGRQFALNPWDVASTKDNA
jgi:phosphoribosyl-dephospho-CoA transferase